MPYKRWQPNRRYTHSEKLPSNNIIESVREPPLKLADIPLPNESEEKPSEFAQTRNRVHKPSIIEFIKEKVTLEEIILIGLIILILDEGIEDEFILIMLIYVLLF